MKTEDDLLWIQRSLKGDTNAFGFLVDKYQDAVFTILRRILKRDDEAADAAQTVFIKAYEALPRFKGEAAFGTWISRIAYNHAISEYRKKKIIYYEISEQNILDYDIWDAENEEKQLSEKEYLLLQLEQEIAKLSIEDNLLISLYYVQRKTLSEISEISGLTVSNLKVKLFRLRQKLKDKLTKNNTD